MDFRPKAEQKKQCAAHAPVHAARCGHCLGGGVLLEDLPPSIASIDVVELESEILAANRRMGPLRHSDPLQDTRIQIVTNDARNALPLTARRYDIIISQPSHPWTAGASHLYTDGFVGLVKSRLH